MLDCVSVRQSEGWLSAETIQENSEKDLRKIKEIRRKTQEQI